MCIYLSVYLSLITIHQATIVTRNSQKNGNRTQKIKDYPPIESLKKVKRANAEKEREREHNFRTSVL